MRAQVETNLWGVVHMTRAALPAMRRQHGGHIIQVSSIGGRQGSAGLAAYQMSKFAVGGFSECLAQEVQPFGIRVTIVEPGGMPTGWAGDSMAFPTDVQPAYESTVGAMVDFLKSTHLE